MQRNALLLIAAATLIMAPAGGASAQRYYSNGGAQNFHISKPPPMPKPPGHDGGHHGGWNPGGGHDGGWHHGGWPGPGIVVVVPPPRGVIVEDGPGDEWVPYHPRRSRKASQPGPRRSAQRSTPSNAPPAGETRYVPDEVVIEGSNLLTAAQITALAQRHRLARIESEVFQLSGTTMFRWRIPDRRSVATVVRELERDQVVASAQPNYLFTLQQSDSKPVQGDPAQYALGKLHLPQAHALAKGDDVKVAVIDSAIDAASPELAGSIAASLDALTTPMKPHKHGTAIAGLIAAHGKLMGAAPDAKILAVRAFDPAGKSAQGSTFAILKGLDWSAAHGARVINMSFAGPSDPAIHRALVAAHKKGIVLVAAAGNAGAKSPPLYPAADANVIAVTATTADNKLFALANRGRHIDVAAPGAQILVAVPDGGYEVSSGTSYSAAEVSGIVALMLQREPGLNPDKVRQILLATARDLGPKGRDSLFGAGLADAYGAVVAEKAPVAQARPVERVSTGSR